MDRFPSDLRHAKSRSEREKQIQGPVTCQQAKKMRDGAGGAASAIEVERPTYVIGGACFARLCK